MSEESLGERIKAERKKRKWSQSRLAEKLGVTNRTVLRWEIKGEIPNNENRLALIELLGFREEDFQPNEQALAAVSPTIELTDLERILPQEEDFKLYSGRRIYKRYGQGHVWRTTYVTVNGRPLKYFDSLERNPEEETVFEWGYPGGAHQGWQKQSSRITLEKPILKVDGEARAAPMLSYLLLTLELSSSVTFHGM